MAIRFWFFKENDGDDLMNAQSDGPGGTTKTNYGDEFEELLESSFQESKNISLGQRVEAKVVSIGREYIFLDLGMRTEGFLPREAAADQNGDLTIAEGDRVNVFVTGFRDGAVMCGQRMSAGIGAERTDDKAAVIEALKEAYDNGMPVEGRVEESIKGGFSVSVMGLRAFCPISQIDNKYCEKPEEHIGLKYGFEIIKLEEDGRNIVVSRRKVLEVEAAEKAQEVWKSIAVDQIFEGTVSSIRAFGAFVDIGGIEGLLHVSEISYERVSDPNEALQVGQKLKVSVKEIDFEKRRISLSLKALMEDPWKEAGAVLKSNQVYKGKVVRIERYGAFVEIIQGVEGLVHVSEMGGEKHIHNPKEVVSIGQEIDVRVLEIDPEAKRISLTMNTEDQEENWRDNLKSASRGKPTMGTFSDLLKGKLK
jgi:small subunit ribosomal protein S1